MSETGGDGLEGLMMGKVSEEVKESDEQIQARIAAAQARIAKNKKDEAQTRNFDGALAELVPELSRADLELVIFWIDQGVPSLTVLAFLAVSYESAYGICHKTFAKFIETPADFSNLGLNEKLEDRLSHWWTFIYGADHLSVTDKCYELGVKENFISKTKAGLQQLLDSQLEVETDQKPLEKVLCKYEDGLFEKKAA